MKLRPYLRGLGIGMIVTAIILHFSMKNANSSEMTDSEIKARAAELGMIENTVLSNTVSQQSVSVDFSEIIEGDDEPEIMAEPSEEPVIEPSDDVATAPSEEPSVEPSASPSLEPSPAPSATPSPSVAPSVVSSPADTDTPVNYVTVTVVSGDSSYAVAKKVYDAGLVTSTALFDQYLCANGYDRFISVGQHRIPVDATDEEIAKILTSGD
jgi:hypothetical protein